MTNDVHFACEFLHRILLLLHCFELVFRYVFLVVTRIFVHSIFVLTAHVCVCVCVCDYVSFLTVGSFGC